MVRVRFALSMCGWAFHRTFTRHSFSRCALQSEQRWAKFVHDEEGKKRPARDRGAGVAPKSALFSRGYLA